ncbi:kinase [Micromonospora sp. WMMA1998]|uniref:GHMP family kinase ATP-binding protein n=1 Tax=unclassified Micromonospora TaxID=2617518 RepID=UPI00248B9B06|nr:MULTISPECIES: kinase [unclassified Micromonospora]WBC16766.1 kinase [Micromonospora sp. WMMA1998]WFE66779.1 kinase [Micromonospora sp. WMMD714]
MIIASGSARAAFDGRPVQVGRGWAYGTFGELLQGVLPEPGTDFLVTLPIRRGCSAYFELHPGASRVEVAPRSKTKSRAVAEAMLRRYGVWGGGRLTLDGDLTEGKGQASSSADLVATVRAVSEAIGVTLTPADIESLLRPIEPTDGVMYPGVVAFLHRQVRLQAMLGHLPATTIVGVDEGGQVDTVDFNRIPKPFGRAERREYRSLLDEITVAIGKGDLATVGAVATRSALLNQRLRPKSMLGDLVALSAATGALGVVAAHSGTILGLLLADDDPDYPDKLARVRYGCRALAGRAWVDRSMPTMPQSTDLPTGSRSGPGAR